MPEKLFFVADSSFTTFIMIYIYEQFVYLVCLEILNTWFPLKRPYIYNILKVCNNILFLLLMRNPLPPLLLPFPGNTVFFIGTQLWEMFFEGLNYRNASIFSCLSFSTLNINWKFGINFCSFSLFHSFNDFGTSGLFWTKWFVLPARDPVVLDHKMWFFITKKWFLKKKLCPWNKI